MKKLIWACLPNTSDTSLETLHLLHYVLLHVHCKRVLMPTCVSKQRNEKWKQKTGRAQDMLIYMMFRKRFDVSTKFTQMTYVYLCQIIRPHQTSREILPQTHPANSTLPTPGGRKSASHWDVYLSEAVECRGAFRHGGRWHWGRRRRRCRRRRTFHRPRRSRPMCAHCALWAPFRSGTADSIDWPGKSGPDVLKRSVNQWFEIVVQNPITILALQKWSWPLARNLPKFLFFQLPHLPFVVKRGFIMAEMHFAMKHTQTQSKLQKHKNMLRLWKPNLRRKACIASMSVHFRGCV